jgi:hypothetical protein
MDIWKLLTAGKVERTIDVDGLEVKMATPAMDQLSSDDPHVNLAQFIVSIGGVDVSTADKRAEVVAMLKKVQPAMFAKLVGICAEMNKEQNDAVDRIVSKKS